MTGEAALRGASVLVVGGAGFVGSNLVHRLLALGAGEIVIVDNLLSAERANIPAAAGLTFIEGSIAADPVLRRLDDRFDYVFHLATYHGNQSSIHDPLADHENNTLTTLKLYERVKGFGRIRRLVYASAGCTVAEKTFGEAHPTAESDPVSLWLDSPYQISKIVGEMYSNYYRQRHGLRVVKARFQNVYGPREILGAGRWRGTPATVWRNVVPTFVYRALKGLPLVLENGGVATRDFIYVDDIVRGLLLCATDGEPGEVYNLASGVETCIADLAAAVLRLTGSAARLECGAKRDWDRSGKRYGDPAKARRALGFEASVALEEGLARTVAWTRGSLPLIDGCIHRHAEHLAALPVAG
jgi:nucleoside-diphosphate-sugar epimerase